MTDDDFVSIPECAQRMGISVDEVWELVDRHALKAYRYAGWGEPLVQPAILSGAAAPKRKSPRTSSRRK
jgi:hypothetical protein